MEAIYFNAFISTLLTYLVTYVIGHILISFITVPSRYPFLKEFLKLCLGFFSIIPIYSLFRTHGITINAGMIFLFGCLVFYLKRDARFRPREEILKELFSLKSFGYIIAQLAVVAVCFIFLFWKIKDPFTMQSYETNADFYNYVILIEHLNKTGVEGGFPDWYSGAVPVRNLYHYGELWYGAFYAFLTNERAFTAFYFQLYAHTLAIYFLGGCAIIELFIRPKRKTFYMLGVLIIFICGISFYLPRTTIFTRGDWWDMGLIVQPKYFFTAIFVLFAFIFTKFQKPFLFILAGMAGILSCSVSAPAILLSVGFIVVALLVSRKITFIRAVQWLIPVIFTVLFIGAYTLLADYLNAKNAVESIVPESTTSILRMPVLHYMKLAVNCFGGQFIKSALSLFPYAVLLFFALNNKLAVIKKHADLILLFFFIHVSSIASYAIFSFLGVDTVQLWSIMYVPYSAIACFISVVVIMNSGKRLLQGGVLVLIVLSCIQTRLKPRNKTVNMDYVSKARKIYDGGPAVSIMSSDFLKRDWSKNINLYPPSPSLKMYFDDYNPVSLSVFEVPKSEDPQFEHALQNIRRNSVLYRYIALQKKNNSFVSIEQSKLDFIQQKKVHYIFTYGDARVPEILRPSVIDSVRDSISRITLYRLKQERSSF